jgi:hypothetical protein
LAVATYKASLNTFPVVLVKLCKPWATSALKLVHMVW